MATTDEMRSKIGELELKLMMATEILQLSIDYEDHQCSECVDGNTCGAYDQMQNRFERLRAQFLESFDETTEEEKLEEEEYDDEDEDDEIEDDEEAAEEE